MPYKPHHDPQPTDNNGALEQEAVLVQNGPIEINGLLNNNGAGTEPSLPRTAPSFQLCLYCQDLIKIWSKSKDELSFMARIQHCESWAALRESAAKGCRVCAQFAFIKSTPWLSSDLHQAGNPKLNALASLNNHRDMNFWDIYLFIDGPDKQTCVGLMLTESASSTKSHWYHNICEANTRSAMPLCKAWLADCSKSHIHGHTSLESWCPTRLIFLGCTKIQLCYSSEVGEIPDYATLSHCWGSAPFLTLNRANIDAFHQEINLEDLTKTFQDAIYIAHYLGLRYIWIDSLCIVQDDPEDWDRESTLMASVYGGSTVNIAASSARDGSSGCFFDRRPLLKCQILINSDDAEFLYDCLPVTFGVTLQTAPLTARGWVVQERILSHRTLHFTDEEVFWECGGKISSESFPGGIPQEIQFRDTSGLRWGWSLSKKNWPALIADYSRKHLTRKSDRLAAISGLARQLHNETKDEYLAGLWRLRLEHYICWHVLRPAQRIDPRIAPTWSWASLDGEIETDGLRFKSEMKTGPLIARVDRVDMAHTLLGAFGPCLAGTLTLRCRYILRARFHIGGQKTNRIHSSLRVESFQTLALKVSCDVLADIVDLPTSVYVVPITFIELPGRWKRVSCLLLTRVARHQGRYERLGHVRFDDGDEGYRMCLQKPSTTKLVLQDGDYTRTFVEHDGSTSWVIEIV